MGLGIINDLFFPNLNQRIQTQPKIVFEYKNIQTLKILLYGKISNVTENKIRLSAQSNFLLLHRSYNINSKALINNPYFQYMPDEIRDRNNYYLNELRVSKFDNNNSIIKVDLDYYMSPNLGTLLFVDKSEGLYDALFKAIRFNKYYYLDGKFENNKLKKLENLLIFDYYNISLTEEIKKELEDKVNEIIYSLGESIYPLKKITVYHNG